MLISAPIDPFVSLSIHHTGLLVRVRSWLGVYNCNLLCDSYCILGNYKQAHIII